MGACLMDGRLVHWIETEWPMPPMAMVLVELTKVAAKAKKGAKSVYTAPSPAPVPLPDGGLLQSWGSAPADVEETQLLRDIQDAMPL